MKSLSELAYKMIINIFAIFLLIVTVNAGPTHNSDIITVRTRRTGPFSELSPEINGVLQSFEQYVKDRLTAWEADQENKLMQLITQQNAIISKLKAEISELKQRNSKIQKSNTEIESFSFIRQQYGNLQKEVKRLKKERQELKLFVKNLERKLKDMRFESRSSTVQVRNVPQKEGEIVQDLVQTVMHIGKAVGLTISMSDLRDIRRLPGIPGTPSATCPIVVEFNSVILKDNMLSAIQEHNKMAKLNDKFSPELTSIPGQWKPIYVTEFLPSSTKKNINLLHCGVISKQEWDGLNPVHVEYLPRPLDLVIIQHTVTSTCNTDTKCADIVRSIQTNHMENLNYWDIGPSFLVGGNGKIYEGSGWLHVGAHTAGYNRRSIGISFIGNFNSDTPTQESIQAVKNLLQCGVHNGHLTENFHVVGHRQVIATESPGRKLYNEIRRWPQWLEKVEPVKHWNKNA